MKSAEIRFKSRTLSGGHRVCGALLLLLLLPPAANGDIRQPSIAGGYQAPERSWPYMAALMSRTLFGGEGRRRGWNSFCGGSYIGGRWVLTAAHCVIGQNSRPFSTGAIRIHLGAGEPPVSGSGLTRVTRIAVHPLFDSSTMAYDIALVKLEGRPAAVPPVPLSGYRELDLATLSFTPAITLGRGAGLRHTSTAALLQADIQLIPEVTCNDRFNSLKAANNLPDDTLRADPVDGTMVCAGSLDGTADACQGDSGGPLLVRYGEEYHLAGITSWGIGCGNPGTYGVYTKVPAHGEWLERVTGLELLPEEAPVRGSGRGYGSSASLDGDRGAGTVGVWSILLLVLLYAIPNMPLWASCSLSRTR